MLASVIELPPEQKEVEDGGTMRLGAQAVEPHAGSRPVRSTATRR